MRFMTVKRAISAVLADGVDDDAQPDLARVTGRVTFTPVLESGDSVQVQTEEGPVTLLLTPVTVNISDGVVMHRGREGVQLFAGGEGSNPATVQWRAHFDFLQAGGVRFALRDVVFDAVPDGVVDLTAVAPVAGTAPPVVRGPVGTSITSVVVDGSDLVVFARSEDRGEFELSRVGLSDVVRAEAEAAAVLAADGVRGEVGASAAAAEQAAASATSQAGIATQQAGVATGAATTATEQARVAAGHADTAGTSSAAAAKSEANAKTSEQAAKQAETNAKSSEERAATIAGSTRWVGTKLEVNGQLSPDLKGDLPVVYSSTSPEDKNVIWVNPDEELPAQTGTSSGGGASGPVSWESVTGKPTEFTPTSHSHGIADTTGLQSALDGKANTSHTHAVGDVTGLQSALDGKAATSHTHTASQISDATTTGKNVLTASSQSAARSAIGAGTSNLAIGTTATTAAAGNHTHTPASIGAAPATHTHAIADTTGLQSALDGKLSASQIQIVPTIPSTTTPGTVYITTV